jgi:hypothetical protein
MPPWITQIQWLFTLAIPVACIAWTVTHEEVFREPREYCVNKSKTCKTIFQRKFFYLFTCEYCFSHYVTIGLLILSGFRLLFSDWRGYVLSGFSIVWIANMYMAIFSLLRFGIKKEKMEINVKEEQIKSIVQENEGEHKKTKTPEPGVREMFKG